MDAQEQRERGRKDSRNNPSTNTEQSEWAGAEPEASPYGALTVAGLVVLLLLIGWLTFYLILFLPRGPVS